MPWKKGIINFKQYFSSTVKYTGCQNSALKKQLLQNSIHKSVGIPKCFIALLSPVSSRSVYWTSISSSIWNVWKSCAFDLPTIAILKHFNNLTGMKMSLLCARALRLTSTVFTEIWVSWPFVRATWRCRAKRSRRNWHTSKKVTRR